MTGMSGTAFGAIELFQWALVFVLLAVVRVVSKRDGREEAEQERAANRSARRAEARTAPARGRHHLAPFPGDDEAWERTTTTGELQLLTAAAETGDLAEIGRQNTAFFRRLDLRRWARAS